MMGRGAYTPEQQQKYDAIVAEFVKQMEPVKDQMFIKRQEMRALQNASNPDIAAVRATATELLQLRKQLGQMHETMAVGATALYKVSELLAAYPATLEYALQLKVLAVLEMIVATLVVAYVCWRYLIFYVRAWDTLLRAQRAAHA